MPFRTNQCVHPIRLGWHVVHDAMHLTWSSIPVVGAVGSEKRVPDVADGRVEIGRIACR